MNFCLVVGCFAIFLALASCVGNERQPERKEKRVSNRRVAVVANATAVGPTNITVNATEAEKSKENVTELLKDDKNATQGNVTETPDIMVAAENKTKENSVTDPPAPNLVVGALAAPPLEGYEEPVKELGTDEEIVNDYVPEFETEPHIPTSNENENILGRQSSVRKYFAVERREPNPEEIVMIPPEKAGVHRKRTPTPKRILKETNAPRVRLIPPARRSHSQQRQDYIVQQRIHRSRDKDLQARKELALMKLVRGRNYQIKEATPVYRETIFMESYNRPDIKNTIILATRHEKKKGQAEDAGSRIYLANQLSPRGGPLILILCCLFISWTGIVLRFFFEEIETRILEGSRQPETHTHTCWLHVCKMRAKNAFCLDPLDPIRDAVSHPIPLVSKDFSVIMQLKTTSMPPQTLWFFVKDEN